MLTARWSRGRRGTQRACRADLRSARRRRPPSPRPTSRTDRPRCNGGRARSFEIIIGDGIAAATMGRMAHLGGQSAAYLSSTPVRATGRPDADELAREAERRGHRRARPARKATTPQSWRARREGRSASPAATARSGAVAEVALERDLPFVCIPFGTRNHFARDIGLDRNDPLGALAAFGSGRERADRRRPRRRARLPQQRVVRRLRAPRAPPRAAPAPARRVRAAARALAVGARPPPAAVRDRRRAAGARVVLVANNAYDLDALRPRRARAARRGTAPRVRRGGLAAAHVGRARPASAFTRRAARAACARRSTASRSHLELAGRARHRAARAAHTSPVSPRHVPATQAELSRIGLLAELPGRAAVRAREADAARGHRAAARRRSSRARRATAST